MKHLFLFLMLSFLSAASFPQNKQGVEFDFDYAQFGYDSVSNYVEFYYSFNQNSLQKVSSDSADYLDGILSIVLVDTSSSDTVVSREWRITHQLSDTASNSGKSLVGVVSFILPKGDFKAEISGYDFNNRENKKVLNDFISINPLLTTDEAKISDIQIASRIIQQSENTNSIFYKNSFEIFPIPVSVFGENQPVLFFYSELYNIADNGSGIPLKLNTLVVNSRKNVVYNKDKLISRNVDSRVEVGSVPVNKLPTDTYVLVLTLIDSAANYGVSSSKRFFVYNPSVAQADTLNAGGGQMLSSQFGVMSEEELDDIFEKSKYVATDNEIDQYEGISTVEGKREALFQFWKNRDRSPETQRNEFYEDYMNRIDASNQRFTAMGKPGWKSDRGRVFITYGEPSEIERYPNQTDVKPYEIWYYNEIEGGVHFVFGDLTGFSDYLLLHSTMRGELRDDSWLRRISTF